MIFRKRKKEVDAVLRWLSERVGEGDVILIQEGMHQHAYFFELPFKLGDKAKKIALKKAIDPSFLIKTPPYSNVLTPGEWEEIFRSPFLELFANKEKREDNFKKPTGEERKIAFKIARKAIKSFLEDKKHLALADLDFYQDLPGIFYRKGDLAVALWCGGMLRGSYVAEAEYLGRGIIDASTGACNDPRFKPINSSELPLTRIEITLISDLKVPLPAESLEKNEIFPDKGYLLKRGKQKGWFLPEVFNVLPFGNLKEFISRLGSEKAHLNPGEIFDKGTEVFIFHVDDFIEGGEMGEILDLRGPVVLKDKKIKESAVRASDWLLKMQEADGNFIPILNPLTGKISQIDWLRSCFAGWSLIEFGKAANRPEYVEAGRQNFFYGKNHILDDKIIKDPNMDGLSLAYLGQEALSLNYPKEAFQCGSGILDRKKALSFEPIRFLQIASFLTELSKLNNDILFFALEFGQRAQIEFNQLLSRKKPVQFAVWAELANLYCKLFIVQGNESYFQWACGIIDWILKYQMADGSIRAVGDLGSNFSYVRSTGKIAEVLAGLFVFKEKLGSKNFEFYKNSLEKIFSWISTMQYSDANSFFIPGRNRGLATGGFRHDYYNQECWIDSAGHFLLACSRFLNSGNLNE